MDYGLKNYWPIENHVNDTVGGAHLYNGVNVEFVEDRFGNPNSAIRFTEGYYQIPPGIHFKGDLTVSLWIKPTLNMEIIMDFTDDRIFTYNKIRLLCSYRYDNNSSSSSVNPLIAIPRCQIFNVDSRSIFASRNPLSIGQWTQLVFTFNENIGSVYMNGLLTGQKNDINTPKNINATLSYIGKSTWIENGNLWADLDDLRIYNRSLSQAEVNSLFLQQVNKGSSNLLGYENV